jgi:hypothetical protein
MGEDGRVYEKEVLQRPRAQLPAPLLFPSLPPLQAWMPTPHPSSCAQCATHTLTPPALLPSSSPGLDARAASIVMRTVRNVGNSKRAVLVTIHQPSIEIFEAFDNLLLLQVCG